MKKEPKKPMPNRLSGADAAKRLHALTNLVPALIWEADTEGKVITLTDRWSAYTGQTAEQTQNWGWLDAIHPQDLPRVHHKFATAFKTGAGIELEQRIRAANGEYRWFHVQHQPVLKENGKVERWFGAAIDIHKTKLAEEELQKSEEKFRLLFNSIDEGFYLAEAIFDAAGKCIDVFYHEENPAAIHMAGRSAKGRLMSSLAPYEQYWRDFFGEVVKTGKPTRREEYAAADGVWYEFYAFKTAQTPGNQFVIIFRDVTARRLSEEAMLQSEKKYRTLFNSVDEGFCIIEMIYEGGKAVDYRFIEANPAFEKQTGLIGAVGKTMRELEPRHEDHWFKIYAKVAKTGKAVRFEEQAAHLAGGVWYQVYAFPFGEKAKNRVAILFNDVTHKKNSERLLFESEERFRTFLDTTSDVVYKMSADWKEMRSLVGKEFLPNTEDPSTNWVDKYIPTEDRMQVWNTINSAIENKSVFELEHRVIRADGSIGWTFSRAMPILNVDEEITEWFGTATDITKSKNAENMHREQEKRYRAQLQHEVQLRTNELLSVKETQQREVFQSTLTALEEERKRISESLHNGFGQLLYGLKISLSGLSESDDHETFTDAKNYASALLSDAIKESRRISHELMPAVLEEFGLNAAIQDICQQLSDGVVFNCKIRGRGDHLERYLQLAVYRTVQELMLNVVNHAEATEATVMVIINSTQIEIAVKDNGKGISDEVKDRKGIGLASIRGKIKLLNGNIDIISNAGTQVKIVIPLKN
ncbi:sensor histidine kinase [Mucilaginibacter ginkgonis]|uniref:histidine kinase n=1 Tax=Mucilaginibacter ginkgonis TaxID=2682091 RepID=A0A6I4I2B5_9SPHI|nr:PAS domain-containing protein [Mucilaginibacter ginkgonis]QQL49425.1 PAS domain-containing protein [Mucilaginibacter ginkgonis]